MTDGAAKFDPQAFLGADRPRAQTAAEASQADGFPQVPLEWAKGIVRLREMPLPRGAGESRWRQIVDDAQRFFDEWQLEAVVQGWSVTSLFGLDLNEANPFAGLLIDIRGDRVSSIGERFAVIRRPQQVFYHYRSERDGVLPIWRLRSAQ